MKYKAKFNADQKYFHTSYTMRVDEEQTFTDVEGLTPGVFVFIPFTDERFFEPVKVRKFEVEVNEEDIDRFMFYNRNEPWTVTEITENKYLEALKANHEISTQVIETMSQFDYVDLTYHAFTKMVKDHGKNERFRVVKDMKDYLNSKFITVNGLKNAKDIVDSWWNL